METFEFTLIASGLDPEAEDFEQRFFEAGCGDATVSFQKGHILVDFAREAPTLQEAVLSAVENVQSTGAVVRRLEPDPLVSLSDMAARSKMSRAAMTHYFKGLRGRDFPAPKARITTESPLWDWADVSLWLYANGRLSQEIVTFAAVLSSANHLISRGETDLRSQLGRRVEDLMSGLQNGPVAPVRSKRQKVP